LQYNIGIIRVFAAKVQIERGGKNNNILQYFYKLINNMDKTHGGISSVTDLSPGDCISGP
jgi:hypothetical protein